LWLALVLIALLLRADDGQRTADKRRQGAWVVVHRRGSVVARCHRALEIAREEQAPWLELRAATSLARLWAAQDRRDEARELLSGIYGWFSEGFDTVDLVEAEGLLGELE
jgi:predicted ATPase